MVRDQFIQVAVNEADEARRAKYISRIFMRPVSFGGRQVYCFHRFHCQFFFTINFSLCQNTNCVCLLSLGGLLRNLSPLGMHVLKGINCTTKSLLISDRRLSYFTVRLMFVRDARFFSCFPTHSPWVVLHEGGREVYYFYRFHCQVFFTINFSQCQNTNCVSRLSLGGRLGNYFNYL